MLLWIRRMTAHRKKITELRDFYLRFLSSPLLDFDEAYEERKLARIGIESSLAGSYIDLVLPAIAVVSNRAFYDNCWTIDELYHSYEKEPEKFLAYMKDLRRHIEEHEDLYTIYTL